MPYDDPIDDEDWYDEDQDADEQEEPEAAHCPECNGPVYEYTDKCPACGYWLTEADRRRLRLSESKPKWVLITAAVILTILLVGALTLYF